MPAQRKSVPTYCLHKQSGRGRAVWTDVSGVRHFKLLPGSFESSESRTAFATLLLEHESSPATVTAAPQGLTLAEVIPGRGRVVVAQVGPAGQLRLRRPGRVGRLGGRIPGPVEVRPEVVEGIVGPVRHPVPNAHNQTAATTCDSVGLIWRRVRVSTRHLHHVNY